MVAPPSAAPRQQLMRRSRWPTSRGLEGKSLRPPCFLSRCVFPPKMSVNRLVLQNKTRATFSLRARRPGVAGSISSHECPTLQLKGNCWLLSLSTPHGRIHDASSPSPYVSRTARGPHAQEKAESIILCLARGSRHHDHACAARERARSAKPNCARGDSVASPPPAGVHSAESLRPRHVAGRGAHLLPARNPVTRPADDGACVDRDPRAIMRSSPSSPPPPSSSAGHLTEGAGGAGGEARRRALELQ